MANEIMNMDAIEEIENNEVNEEVVSNDSKVNIGKIALIAGTVIGGCAITYGIYRGVKALREDKELKAKIELLKAQTELKIEEVRGGKVNEQVEEKKTNEPRNREERRAEMKKNKK